VPHTQKQEGERMANKTGKIIPEIAFLSGIPLPAKLKALTDAVNVGTFNDYDLNGAFALGFEPAGDMATWFAVPATLSAKYAADATGGNRQAGIGQESLLRVATAARVGRANPEEGCLKPCRPS